MEKTKKRIAATILAGSIAFFGVGAVGCYNSALNNTNPPIVAPEGDDGSAQTPDYSKCSQILKNVLTDFYYYELISLDNSYYETTNEYYHYQNAKYNAIPYGFLEDEGFDIDKIKNNQVSSQSDMYLDGNDLFIELRIENKASTNYFTNYILKYSLTDQEINELDILFKDFGSRTKETFYQAPFFIQELSYLKTPEVVNKSYITVDGIRTIEQRADDNNYIYRSNTATFLSATVNENNKTTHSYQIHLSLVNPNGTQAKGTMKIAQITFTTFGNLIETINNTKVIRGTQLGALLLTDQDKANMKASIKTVKFYTCQNAELEDISYHKTDKDLLLGNN